MLAHSYDADGNLTAVDGGSTASYVYNALNQRVRTVVGGAATEFVFAANGARASEWNAANGAQLRGHYYFGAQAVAYYVPGAGVHFLHQNWLGTTRVQSSYNGGVEAQFGSLVFGDGQQTVSGDDPGLYAGLDYDAETATDHAQFRQYGATQGRWMMPDPYSGSYDLSNPQSMNRYAYALNNPLAFVDPSGLECVWDDGSYDSRDDPDTRSPDGCAAAGGTWVDPQIFEGVEGNQPGSWSGDPNSAIAWDWNTPSAVVYGQTPNMDTTVIDSMIFGFQTAPNNGLPKPTLIKATIPGTNYCGPGGNGTPTNQVDASCAAHDLCYQNAGVSFVNNLGWPKTAQQTAAIQACDANLCSSLGRISWPTSGEPGQATLVSTFFGCSGGYSLR